MTAPRIYIYMYTVYIAEITRASSFAEESCSNILLVCDEVRKSTVQH